MSAGLRTFRRNLLEIINKQENKALADVLHERRFKKRHLLFMPHHREDLVFIVKSGKLRVYLGLDGKELSLAMMGPGDIYTTHSRCYVEAMEDTVILACPVFRFFKAAMQCEEFMLSFITAMGGMLSNSIGTIERIYFHDIDKRVAAFFYEQGLQMGEKDPEGIRLHVGLTVDNIAKIVGSSRQTVSTLISGMEKDGILKKQARGEYVIHDLEELRLLAMPCAE